MAQWIVDQVLLFIEEGHLWMPGELDSLLARLRARPSTGAGGLSPIRGDDLAAALAAAFAPLEDRRQAGPLPLRLRSDLEAIVYPRLWKLVEGMQGDVTPGELQNRINALQHGIAHVLDEEDLDADFGGGAAPTASE